MSLRPSLDQFFPIALIVYAFAWQVYEPAYQAGETLLVLLFLISVFRPSEQALRRDPAFLLCMALLVYLILAFAYLSFSLPEGMEQNPRFSRYYLKPLLIVVIAHALVRARWVTPWHFLIAIGLGLLCMIALEMDAKTIDRVLRGRRMDFSFHNAQHTGVVFTSALIALLIFSPRALRSFSKSSDWVWNTIYIVSTIVCCIVVLATQVRAAWLALILAFPVLGVLVFITRSRKPQNRGAGSWLAAGIVVILCVSAGAWLVQNSGVERRAERLLDPSEKQIAQWQKSAALTHVNKDGISIRLASWSAALTWISERPLIGWGPATAKHLIEQSDYFKPWFKRRFGHVHNSYLEALLALGILGVLPILGLILRIGWTTIQGYRHGDMPRDVFIFAWTFFAYWSVVNCFESYIMYNSGHVVNATVGGFLYYFHLKTAIGGRESPTPPPQSSG